MATTLSKGPTFESILSDVKEGKLKPAYLLMGVENYYIEKLSDAIIEATLPEEERDFNMHVFYGNDSDINSIVNAAQSFPMGSEHSLVIVKEAQDLKDLENISYYLQNPCVQFRLEFTGRLSCRTQNLLLRHRQSCGSWARGTTSLRQAFTSTSRQSRLCKL